MQLKLDKRFKKNVSGKIGKHKFAVGVLQDGPHYWPSYGPTSHLAKQSAPRTGSYAGGPVRTIYRGSWRGKPFSGSLSEVSQSFRRHLGFNYLQKPFNKKSEDIIKFMKEWFKITFQRSGASKKRAENLLQAVVRNPILRGDYGHNSSKTRKIKGFDRHGIDTGQLFKAIKARVS